MRHRLDGLRPRTRWLVSFALFSLLSGCWSLASPLFSGPDEPSHVVNAAAVVRGQLLPPVSGALAQVRVPAIYASASAVPVCYMFRTDVPASCAGRLRGSTTPAVMATPAARYPPLYYAIVGVPTLVFPAEAGIRLMRLLSCLVCAGFLGGALSAAESSRSLRWLVVGVAVAVTPLVLFLAGTVNPNSLEIAAALCLWVCGLALAGRPGAGAEGGLVAGTGISACTMVLTRGLSPLWLGCIGLTLLVVAGRARVVELFRRVDVRRWAVAVVLSSLVAVAWITLAGTNRVDTSRVKFPTTQAAALRSLLDATDSKLREMIGLFGWLDAPASTLTYSIWFFAIGLLLLLGLAVAAGRVRLTLVLLIVVVVVLPALLGYQVVRYLGPVWQGRYTLPIAVGVPMLSAYALTGPVAASAIGDHPPTVGSAEPRLARGVLWALAIGHVAAFLWVLRRYTVGGGLTHKLDLFSGPWQPPLGAAGLSLLFLGAVIGYVAWLIYLSENSAYEQGGHSDSGSRRPSQKAELNPG